MDNDKKCEIGYCELLGFFLTTKEVLIGKEFTQDYKIDFMDPAHLILIFDYSCGEQILYLGKSIACQEYMKNGLSNMYINSSVYSLQFCSIVHFMFMYILCEVLMYIWVTFFLQYHLFENVYKSTKNMYTLQLITHSSVPTLFKLLCLTSINFLLLLVQVGLLDYIVDL